MPGPYPVGPNVSKVETVVDVDALLKSFNTAFLDATKQLSAEQRGRDEPMVYCIPKMQLTIQLSLTFSESKVKGILWSKTTSSSEQNVLSTIQVELVAVPRDGR